MLNRRAALAAPLALAMPALAQATWRPDRPIRVIIPHAPGGGTDVVTRVLAEAVGTALGQPLVIENRTGGAAGLVGTDLVAKAAPDGYTILVNSSAQAITPALVSRMPYDAVNDFAGIGIIGFAPHVVVVNPQLPARTFQELLALLRAHPGRYNLASGGIGSAIHLAGEILRASAQVDFQIVQYRGGGPSMLAVLSNEAQMSTPDIPAATAVVRAGSARPLVIAAPERSPAMPDVPTSAEAGLPNFIAEIWFPVLAPARTPPAVVAALSAAFQTAIEQNKRRLTELAVQVRPGFTTSEQVMGYVRAQMERSVALLRAAGVQPE
ncbi:tripartite tricarboxylate transporter substrate binding protein [Roseococcus sp. SDR]|uniref:Bug family tripartite tricarboxylate transporter substrate binding protein n=1 Tax=Roseococcus sp. SDR TaxID=2835532 RepID=UPI001BCE5FC5|nr:tripartite tricarboxylate transporter substrate-binding protein [Roseococcus sp. SDR]MBS7792756.1 tripartite tricarboxylate transporter substrate binding protein [Roseococcus sp. SDR]MBV1848070.1 tripartite tricarboxylate transporter substrate binding protein [Roseococcus sp. SDR]